MASRRESSFTLTTPDGERRPYTLLSDITPDDLVRIATKAYAREKRGGVEYSSPFTREVRDALVRTRVTQRS